MTVGELKDLLAEYEMEKDDCEIVVGNTNTMLYYPVDEVFFQDSGLGEELIIEISETMEYLEALGQRPSA